MTKIKVIIPITSISVNTIQHHLPSSGRQKEIIMRSRKKDATATVYGVLRISYDTVNIISHLSEYVNLKKVLIHFCKRTGTIFIYFLILTEITQSPASGLAGSVYVPSVTVTVNASPYSPVIQLNHCTSYSPFAIAVSLPSLSLFNLP